MSVPGTEKGTRLTVAEKRAIRAELVRLARTTGHRAYRFAWDRDGKVQVTAFPSGKSTIERVSDAGLSLEPRRRLLAAGVSARVVGVACAALAVAADVASRVL